MNDVLYRKYRASTFSEIVGQGHVVKILTRAISSGKVSHAYLFAGPRGTGKTSIARLLAKGISCLNFSNHNDVCNECDMCRLINAGGVVDIIEMDAASNRGIEEIRNLKDNAGYMPSILKRKVYILDEAHMLTKEAFNALLKILEEPPAHVVFIMATTEPHKLPVTILSRVQRYDLYLASEEELIGKLKRILDSEGFSYDESALKSIYRFSGGSFRDAESLLGKIMMNSQDKAVTMDDITNGLGLIDNKVIEGLVGAVLAKDIQKTLDILANITQKSSNVNYFVEQMIVYIRDLMIGSINGQNSYSLGVLLRFVGVLLEMKNDLRDFNNKDTLLQIYFLKIINNLNVTNSEKNSNTVVSKNDTVQTNPVVKNESTKVGNIGDVSNGNLKFMELIGTFNGRFKIALQECDIVVSGNTVEIRNPYKHNTAYLLKNENISVLKGVAQQIFGETGDVKIIEIERAESESDNVEDEDIPVDATQKALETIQEASKQIDNGVKKDNTNLVESILLVNK